MKNLKKLVSVVLTLALLISTMATSVIAIDYADVKTTDANFEAIDILSGLNILKGDELGNFNPDAEIKRSEVAAVIARALGQEDAALGTTGYSSFADVSADHWAVGYINWAAQQGIVNGRDAQTFDPDAPVKYQEVTKMLVEALGYGPLAAKRGGYPTGHMVIASSNAITSGISLAGDANAPRKAVAQLVYNALDVPLMDSSIITASGDDEYAIYNGKGDNERRTILSYYLEIAKVKAEVVATSKGAFDDDYEIKLERGDEEKATLDITSLVGYDSFVEDGDVYYDDAYNKDNVVEAFCGNTDADEMLGYNVIAYIGKDAEDEDRIFAITPDTKKFNVLDIKDWYDSINTAKDPYVVEYYEDGDTANDIVEIDVAVDAKVIVNGTAEGTIDDETIADTLASASSVVFMGPKNDDYNRIFVTEYDYAIVSEVDVENEVIEMLKGDDIALDDEDLRYTITLDGEAIELADLKEYDVLNVVWQDAEDKEAGSSYVDIYVNRDSVEGVVTEYDSDYDEYTIDGVAYKTVSGTSLSLSDEGTFYLTIDGKVIYSVATAASKDYAFITRVDADTEFGTTTYYVEMLTADGVLADYTVASSLKLTKANGTKETLKRANGGQDYLFAGADTTATGDDTGVITAALVPQATEADALATIANRFISYTLNASGEISAITFAKGDKDSNASVFDSEAISGPYKPDTNRIDGYTYSDSTKLFFAPANEVSTDSWEITEDDVTVGSFSSLEEDENYAGFVYSIGNDKTIGAVVLTEDTAATGIKNALAVVTGTVTGTNKAGEEADGYSIVQAGESLTIYESDDVSTDFAKGDIIYYAVDGSGDIKSATLVYDADANGGKGKLVKKTKDGDYGFAFGKIVEKESSYFSIANELTNKEYDFGKDEPATYATIDTAKASTKSYVTALSSTASIKESGKRDTYVAVIKVNEDGDAIDVIQIKTATEDFSDPEYKIDWEDTEYDAAAPSGSDE